MASSDLWWKSWLPWVCIWSSLVLYACWITWNAELWTISEEILRYCGPLVSYCLPISTRFGWCFVFISVNWQKIGPLNSVWIDCNHLWGVLRWTQEWPGPFVVNARFLSQFWSIQLFEHVLTCCLKSWISMEKEAAIMTFFWGRWHCTQWLLNFLRVLLLRQLLDLEEAIVLVVFLGLFTRGDVQVLVSEDCRAKRLLAWRRILLRFRSFPIGAANCLVLFLPLEKAHFGLTQFLFIDPSACYLDSLRTFHLRVRIWILLIVLQYLVLRLFIEILHLMLFVLHLRRTLHLVEVTERVDLVWRFDNAV